MFIKISNKLSIMMAALLIIIGTGCEQKVNTPNVPDVDIAGTWELSKYSIILPDSTIIYKVGIDYPLIMRVFSNGGNFEQIINDDLLLKYSVNQWTIKGATLTLNFTDGKSETWTVKVEGQTMVLERAIVKDAQSATEKMEFSGSEKIQFGNNPNLVGSWKLNLTALLSETADSVFTPEESGINETFNFDANTTFTETVDNNGQVTNRNGNWFTTYYLLVLKYNTGQVKIYDFGIEQAAGTVTLTAAFLDPAKVKWIEIKEFQKQ